MDITEKVKAYFEKMLQERQPDLMRTNPEFIERFVNFTFDEVVNELGKELDDEIAFYGDSCNVLRLSGSR